MLQSCVLAQENLKYDLSGRLKETERIPAPPKQGIGVLKHAKKKNSRQFLETSSKVWYRHVLSILNESFPISKLNALVL